MADGGDISINLRLENQHFTASIANSGRLLRELRQDLVKAAGATQQAEHRFNSFTGHFKSFMMTVAATRFALMDIHQVFLALPSAFVKASGEIERMTKLMAGLSKESDTLKRNQEAVANTKYVFNLAKNAPFEVKALSDAFVKLKTVGLDPAGGSLNTLVDSVAKFGGTGEHLHRASIAIQQMVGKGVISMEELRQQLGEAVPTAMQAMATGTGMSMGELVDKISKGTVEARSALERMFAVMKVENDGAAMEMMNTYVGQLEKLKTTWMLFANEVGNSGGFLTEVKNQLIQLNDVLSSESARQFAHGLSLSLAEATRAIADIVAFVQKYSDEIALVGRAMIAIWGGTKLLSIISSVKSAYGAFVATYVGGLQTIIQKERENAVKIAQSKRDEIVAHGAANAERIRSTSATAAAELAANRAKYAELDAESNAWRAKFNAAEKVWQTKRMADGRFASAQEIANQQALATAYFERAMAAERMALQIKAAEAGLVAASTGSMAALRANTAATAASLAAVGTTATAVASKVGILRGAIGLLGGPIGIVTTLVTAGIWAWFEWGRSSEEAAEKANSALQRVKDGYASLGDAQQIQSEIVRLEKELSTLREQRDNTDPGMMYKGQIDKIDKSISAVESRLSEYRSRLTEATRQGNESAIQTTVRIIEQRAEREVLTSKAASNKVIQAELAENDRKLREHQINSEEHQKKKSELTKRMAVEYANAEINAYKTQISHINAEINKIDSGAVAGVTKTSARYEGYLRQLQAMTEKLRLSETALESAEKIGTNPDFVSKKGNNKLTQFERDLDSIRQKIAGVKSQLQGDGANIGATIEKWKQQFNRGAISKKNLDDLLAAAREFKELDDAQAANKGADSLLKRAQDQFVNLTEKADGGSGAIAKLRNQIYALMASTTDFDALDKLDAALNLTYESEAADNGQKLKKSLEAVEGYHEKVRALNVELTRDQQEQLRLQYANEVESELAKIELRRKSGQITQEGYEKETAAFLEWQRVRYQKLVEDLRTPMQKFADQWNDVTKQLRDASTKWADTTVDVIVGFAKTGKLEWRSLAESILSDLLRIHVKKSFSNAITGAIDMGVGALGRLAGGASNDKKQDGDASFWDEVVGGVKKFWNSITGSAEATDELTGAVGDTIAKQALEVFGITNKITAEQYATASISSLGVSAANAAIALQNIAASGGASGAGGGLGGLLGDMFGGGSAADGFGMDMIGSASVMEDVSWAMFANGGVMTEFGPVSLRKYANGGIANSPQLAYFGEGSMNEAYVPLPDGRSIPVTFTGESSGGVTSNVEVNITINQDNRGTTETKSNSGDAGQWTRLADNVKAVVRQELATQQRPGGILYR